MATRVVRFGDFEFEDRVISFTDNFSNLVPRTQRLPGLSGGYSEFGTTAPPQEIGRVTYRHQVLADDADDMRAQLDEFRTLIGYGMKKLVIEPSPGEADRWTWAVLNNIQMFENVRDRTDRQMEIVFDWQVSDPRWYGDGNETGVPEWGGGSTWAGGARWGGTTATYSLSGTSTGIFLTNNGNAPTYPRISIMTYAGQTVTNPIVQRTVNSHIVDQVAYTGVLGAHHTLVINARTQDESLQSQGAYDGFSALNPDWFKLMPGSNTIVIRFSNSGDAARVRIAYNDAFY